MTNELPKFASETAAFNIHEHVRLNFGKSPNDGMDGFEHFTQCKYHMVSICAERSWNKMLLSSVEQDETSVEEDKSKRWKSVLYIYTYIYKTIN